MSQNNEPERHNSSPSTKFLPDKPYSELERSWKERWRKAKHDLEVARAYVQALKETSSDRYGADNAYRLALEEETAALIEYSRVLRIYTDLVVHGNVPDEGQATSAE